MAKPTKQEIQDNPRVPTPHDIQNGDTQFLRYHNGLIRGKCNSQDCVLITWSSGFTESAKANTWNDREFLEKPELARLVSTEDFPSAYAFFHRAQEDNKKQVRKSPRM